MKKNITFMNQIHFIFILLMIIKIWITEHESVLGEKKLYYTMPCDRSIILSIS